MSKKPVKALHIYLQIASLQIFKFHIQHFILPVQQLSNIEKSPYILK